jgi:hypothetical protein
MPSLGRRGNEAKPLSAVSDGEYAQLGCGCVVRRMEKAAPASSWISVTPTAQHCDSTHYWKVNDTVYLFAEVAVYYDPLSTVLFDDRG